jgi:glycosyltransferase involved in cell wall biosynthesis
MRLTAVILTKDEARNVVPCIETLSWCDEVVVFDAFSTDGTPRLAEQAGAQVIQHPFFNFAQQRNAALDAVKGDWIFFVDADERATPELGREIRQVIEREDVHGWWVPRHNYVFGKLMRGAGYYPDYQMRLLRAGRGRYERPASEIVVLTGADDYLTQPMIHYNYETIAAFHAKQRAREAFEATTLHRQGVRLRPRTFVLQPIREFWRRFVTLKGYRDGWHGLLLCILLTYYFGWRNYVCLWQMRRLGELSEPEGGNHGGTENTEKL